jgi:hypothetical protein
VSKLLDLEVVLVVGGMVVVCSSEDEATLEESKSCDLERGGISVTDPILKGLVTKIVFVVATKGIVV